MGQPTEWSAITEPPQPTLSLCALCARRGKTCCQNHEIYLTRYDVERISAHTGRDDFFEYKVPQDVGYLPDPSDPIWSRHAFRQDYSRRILRFSGSGDCPFLAQCGCSLPLLIRPLVCRLHPHHYDHQGLCGLEHECPQDLLGPGQDLLTALQMSDLEPARGWREQLYQELVQEDPTR